MLSVIVVQRVNCQQTSIGTRIEHGSVVIVVSEFPMQDNSSLNLTFRHVVDSNDGITGTISFHRSNGKPIALNHGPRILIPTPASVAQEHGKTIGCFGRRGNCSDAKNHNQAPKKMGST
jgi:hypothetical protein